MGNDAATAAFLRVALQRFETELAAGFLNLRLFAKDMTRADLEAHVGRALDLAFADDAAPATKLKVVKKGDG